MDESAQKQKKKKKEQVWINKKGERVHTKEELKEIRRNNLAKARLKKNEQQQIKKKLAAIAKGAASEAAVSGDIAEQTNKVIIQTFWDPTLGGYDGFVKWAAGNKKDYYKWVLPKALEKLIKPGVEQRGIIFNLIGMPQKEGNEPISINGQVQERTNGGNSQRALPPDCPGFAGYLTEEGSDDNYTENQAEEDAGSDRGDAGSYGGESETD